MGCVASNQASPSRAGQGTPAVINQHLDEIPEEQTQDLGSIHTTPAQESDLISDLSGKYTPRGGEHAPSIPHGTLLSMAMESAMVTEAARSDVSTGASRRRVSTRTIGLDHADEDHSQDMPDAAYSIRDSTSSRKPLGGNSSSGIGLSSHPGLSKSVVVNRPTLRILQPKVVNDDFTSQHGWQILAAMQPFSAAGPRRMPFIFPGQPTHASLPGGPRGYPMVEAFGGQPFGAAQLGPIDQANYGSPTDFAAPRGHQLFDFDLGNSSVNSAGGRGRGRGLPAIIVSPTTILGPGGFRGPMISVGGPMVQPGRGQIPFVVGRGRGQPLQNMIPGSQNSHRGDFTVQATDATGRSQRADQPPSIARAFSLSSRESNDKPVEDSGEDEDDNDDLAEEDEDVEDWGLEVGAEQSEKPPSAGLISASQPHSHGSTNLSPTRKTPTSKASLKKKKFGLKLDLDGEIEAVDSGDDNEDDSDDDICGDSDIGGETELHDWLDTDPEPMRQVAKQTLKPLSPPRSEKQSDQPLIGSARTPHGSPSKTSYVPLTPSPTKRLAHPPSTASPHPPLPSHQASLRHLQALAIGGNTSPTRPAGAAPPGVSPVKPPSYRSNIVTSGVPPMLPHLSAIGSPSAAPAEPGKEQNTSGIRDTKVVKKKRAELPRANLPHPAPKFGDWLNSRTMINNYIILESLGAGSYAEVKLCKEKASGKLFAMKFINRDVMKKDKLGKQSKLDDIKREIAIMKKLNHPNVLRLYEVMDDPSMNKLFLVLEYMKHGDLLSHQKKKHPSGANENLHDRDLHCVTLQVILGLAYLHEQKIVHGDIKPQNLLVGDRDVVKIADFGISQSLYGSKQKLSDTAGTPAFMSPEMCSGQEYSGQLADIWAVGATVFMLKYGEPPFVAKSALQMFERIQNDPLVFPGPIDPMLEDLLRGMLTKDPLQRMTLLQIMTHPWVTKEEHPSHFVLREKTPQITVTNDEVDNAIDTSDKFAIIVNIRVQMMKRLQQSRAEILKRRQVSSQDHSDGDKMLTVDMARELADSTSSENHSTHSHSRKAVRTGMPKIKSNKVFVEASAGLETGGRVLSSEEIHYRSQLFSRKKASGVAGMNGTSSVGFPTGIDRDEHQTPDSVDANLSPDDGGEDDDDFLSDNDDEDDEQAVSQSPQLLDELLLTTLSMPPLTKSNLPHEAATSLATHSPSPAAAAPLSAANGRALSSNDPADTQSFFAQNHFLNVTVAVSSLQGRRNTQEDRWAVLPEITTDASSRWSKSLFAGLYDGHGGDECASILQDQLHAWLFRAPDTHFAPPERLQSCLLEFDSFLCDFLLHKGDLSGSTATWLLVDSATSDPSRGLFDLLVGHVGDCRLVLSRRDGSVTDVTSDHRLSLAAERERVLQLGGRVVNNRVNGVMAVTRAFGDLEFKGRLGKNPFHDERTPALLTARPDVLALRVDAARDEFLLLACDGLWDVLSSAEAAEILRDRLHFHGDLSLAARELAQEAIRRYSNDNISVLVVRFE